MKHISAPVYLSLFSTICIMTGSFITTPMSHAEETETNTVELATTEPTTEIPSPISENIQPASLIPVIGSSGIELPDIFQPIRYHISLLAQKLGLFDLLPNFLRDESLIAQPLPTPLPTTPPNTEITPTTPTTTTTTYQPLVLNTQEPQNTCSEGKTVAATRLVWGVKESFRTYISGSIAKGKWDLNNVQYSSGVFTWTGTGGTINPQNTSGNINMNGSVLFTGHNGVLSLRIADPEIRFNGSQGQLIATVTSNDMQGNSINYGRVTIANLVLAQININESSITAATQSVTLTEAGAQAFSSYYKAGDQLDPLTFGAALTDSCGQGTQQTISQTRTGIITPSIPTQTETPTPTENQENSEEPVNQFRIKSAPGNDATQEPSAENIEQSSEENNSSETLWIVLFLVVAALCISLVVHRKKKNNP